jgi:hypothetical protein
MLNEQATRDAVDPVRRVFRQADFLDLLGLVEELRKAASEAVVYNEGSHRSRDLSVRQRRAEVRSCLARVLDYAGCLDTEIVALKTVLTMDTEIGALPRKADTAEQST